MSLKILARFAAVSGTAILLSGCSWLGSGYGNTNANYSYKNQYANNKFRAGYAQSDPCQISSPTQAIPQGCRPEQVTLAIGGQNNAYNQYQQAQYTNAGYGTHVNNARNVQAAQQRPVRYKRPRLRGQLGLGIDYSLAGELYNPGVSGSAASYNRALYVESNTEGSVASGTVTNNVYTSAPERINAPAISIGDVYTAPAEIKGGLEFILSDHATIFANAGYTRAEGKKGGGAEIVDTLLRTVTVSNYNTDPANGPVGALLGTTTNTTFIPNRTVATYDYDFSDLEKYDFEVGGRYYFNPILKGKLQRPLTPFVSASAGASHYNATSVQENQRQLFLTRAFENQENTFYDVNFGNRTQIYDAQWVPYGALKAGLEWQISPKTALAFETGIKYEKARDFSNGTKGDDNISVPLTIRGSYNF